MDLNIIFDGYNLPQCSRGMIAERVEITTLTTTTTTTTTTRPEEVYEEEEFLVKNYGSSIPYGWRLASVADVRDSSGYVKSSVRSALSEWEWCIACLENDSRVRSI